MNFVARLGKWWMQLSSRDRRAVLLGLVVLMPAILWGAAIRPYLAVLDETRDRVEVERTLLARERGLLANADLLPAQLERATSLLDREAESLLRASSGVVAEAALTDILQRAASRSRVLLQEIRGVDMRSVPDTDAVHPIRLALRAESDLHGMAAFLNRLEGDAMLMRILELSVEPGAGDARRAGATAASGQTGTLGFSFIVEAYWTEFGSRRTSSVDVIDTRLTGIPQ